MRTVSLTEGSIVRGSLLFTVPLILGNLFQQLYSATDSLVVGNFVGSGALAAVSASNQIVNLVIGFVIGLTTGAGIVIARHYGAGEYAALRRCISTAYLFCLVGGAAVSALGIAVSPVLLHLINTPEEIFADSVLYLRIYFLGTLFNILYNMGAGVLQAVADTRHPLYYLCAASAVNIILDVLFVAVFRWGVAGAAIATISSQLLSAILVVRALMKTDDMYKLEWNKVRIDRRMLQRIVRIGIPAGMQSVMYNISNVIIQAGVNTLGTDNVTAWATYGKVDGLYWMMINALGISVTTFVGQNFGAQQYHRVRKSIWVCMGMAALTTILFSVLFYFAASPLIGLFSTDQAVLAEGVDIMRFLAPWYIAYVCIEIFSGAIRGTGDSLIPMLITTSGVCVLRVVWIYAVLPLNHTFHNLVLSYPVSWILTSILFLIYYFQGGWMRRRIKKIGFSPEEKSSKAI